jgi:UDP-glucuronate 4-epimerase
MKILVTGGAGFIGSALAKRLFSDGHIVTVIDSFNEYYDVSLKRSRQQVFLEGVQVYEGDITDEVFLQKLFTDNQFDVVCHLAAQAGVRYSVENPDVYIDTNIRGTQLLLDTMRKFGVMRMVFASSSSVYGNTTQAPFNEQQPADKPASMYAATKRAGELIAHTYASMYDMDITCLRFFTVYGPWSRPDMAMLKFAHKIVAGEEIDMYNNGNLRRDFTYIDDIVEGFVLAVEKPLGYEIINLGNGSPVELNAFVDLLEQKLALQAKKNMLPMQQGDVYETYADTTKAKELLGFEPKVSFGEGIQRFVDWYRSFYTK